MSAPVGAGSAGPPGGTGPTGPAGPSRSSVPAGPARLDDNERREILRIARVCLKEWLRSGRMPPGAPHRTSLLVPAGAQVTLQVDGDVRTRCRVDADRSLYLTVARLVIEAASASPPLTPALLPSVRVQVAIFSSAERLARPPEGLEVGRHGVAVSRGEASAVLLPRAAVDGGWDAERLLAETCRAAGLPDDAWRDEATSVRVFEADVFAEP